MEETLKLFCYHLDESGLCITRFFEDVDNPKNHYISLLQEFERYKQTCDDIDKIEHIQNGITNLNSYMENCDWYNWYIKLNSIPEFDEIIDKLKKDNKFEDFKQYII